MQVSAFFEFSSKFVSTTFTAFPIGPKQRDEREKISVSFRLMSGDYSSISFPVTFRHDHGQRFQDILDTGHPSLFLISDRMKSVLEENSLTGWSTFPIRLIDKAEYEIKNYYGLSVLGRCGPIDISRSEVVEKRLVPNGPVSIFYRGLYPGLDEWDRSDFFLPKHNFGIIVTAKAAHIIKANKLTNVQLANLEEIELAEGTAKLIQSKLE